MADPPLPHFIPTAELAAIVQPIADFTVLRRDALTPQYGSHLLREQATSRSLVVFNLARCLGEASGFALSDSVHRVGICRFDDLELPHLHLRPASWLERVRSLFAREPRIALRDPKRLLATSRTPSRTAPLITAGLVEQLALATPELSVEMERNHLVVYARGAITDGASFMRLLSDAADVVETVASSA